jgi:hypothetical protein
MKTALIIIILLAGILLAVYTWLGGFRKIHFTVKEAGGEMLVYESHTGDYKNVGKVIDRMYYVLLNEEKVECFRGFGIYYDNPQKVEKSKLRAEVGNILENPGAEVLEQLTPKYNIKTLEKQDYLVAEFPYRNQLSVILGIMKVYPAMNRYIEKHQLPKDGFVMEIYDVPGKMIIYRKQL